MKSIENSVPTSLEYIIFLTVILLKFKLKQSSL